jgi:methionyl-tRNA formyltransferase
MNIHASLLPAYRGAAPIQAAIRDGLTETGVTIMQMVPALDAGPVILALRTPIEFDETAGELQLRLAELGAESLIEALALISMGKAAAAPQNDALATYAKKIVRVDARMAFEAPSDRVARLVRAYDPKPGAWTTLNGVEVRCFGAQDVPDRTGLAGEVLEAGERGLVIACAEGAVRIAEVHPSGQTRIAVGDWVRGRGVEVGSRFS